MRAAPRNRTVAAAIRQTASQFSGLIETERVVFLGAEGLSEAVVPSQASPSALLQRRDELLREGRLRAIVHVGVLNHLNTCFTVAETFDDPEHPEVHCLITWPQNYRWVAIPPEAMEHWLSYWHVSEEGEE